MVMKPQVLPLAVVVVVPVLRPQMQVLILELQEEMASHLQSAVHL
jgi:hypothetical protein